uniref:N-acetyltransferase domain-containing protein n=1 Tax=Ciona savignyi TaxID=51511 RepID=H2Z7I6_CIOSA
MKSAISYRYLNDDDIYEVSKFLDMHYTPYEPMVQCLGLTNEEMRVYSTTESKETIPLNLSIAAIDDETNKICGISMCAPWKPKPEVNTSMDKMSYLFRFAQWSETTLAEELETTNILVEDIIAVSQNLYNQGIGTELFRRTEQLAIDRCFDYIVGFATSDKTVKMLSTSGWKCMKKLDMSSYRDSYT